MKLLYFAWVRQTVGCAQEEVPLPAGVADVAGLLAWLEGRGGGYARALRDRALVRVAVNHAYAGPATAVADGDEVALFPPVTGG